MKTKSLEIILAATARGEIGINNTIPWRLKGDLKRFKEMTLGNVVIMGRKTYESLPAPLTDRTVIVVSRFKKPADYLSKSNQHIYTAASLTDAITLAQNVYGEKIFIAGGVRIYEEAMNMKDITVHLTLVHKDSDNGYDAIIPNFSMKELELENMSAAISDFDANNFPIPSHTYLMYRSKDHAGYAFINPIGTQAVS